MLAHLPVEIILLICQYPEFKDLGQLAWCNNRMMRIIKKYLPIAFRRKILFCLYYRDNDKYEERICLFNSFTCSVEETARFHYCYWPFQVATTQNKIFGINNINESFEIYDLNAGQISRGPDPPEWREWASVAYCKDKLYYLGGDYFESVEQSKHVDVLIDGKWQTGPAFPFSISCAQTITCDEILYVIGKWNSNMIFLLSADEREWIKIGELPELRGAFGVALLNGRIYITGGSDGGDAFKSCLCFNPSAPDDNQISRIADMNYARYGHSLIVANGKLYAIGGFFNEFFCNSIEEYDPQMNEWRVVGELT